MWYPCCSLLHSWFFFYTCEELSLTTYIYMKLFLTNIDTQVKYTQTHTAEWFVLKLGSSYVAPAMMWNGGKMWWPCERNALQRVKTHVFVWVKENSAFIHSYCMIQIIFQIFAVSLVSLCIVIKFWNVQECLKA